jgi:DNA methyltransferase 1-associated protein 1
MTTKSSHQAAALRSYKIPTPKQAVASRVSATLTGHGVTSSRLVMPTRENLLHLESLIDATSSLLEARKNVVRVEDEIRLLKGRVELNKKDGQLGNVEGEEEPMDVDQEAVADDDNAEIHPGRGTRKKNVSLSAQAVSKVWTLANLQVQQARRSMSIASVDPAAHLGRSNKRQKQG